MNTAHPNESANQAERTREGSFIAPPVDIYENAEGLVVFADMPGVNRENVHIDMEKNQLTITARRTRGERQGQLVAGEFRAFDYYRAFLVPQDIDAEHIGAELKNGVLRVVLPKRTAARPRRIEVRGES